jgi:hypothetical protein
MANKGPTPLLPFLQQHFFFSDFIWQDFILILTHFLMQTLFKRNQYFLKNYGALA